MKKNILIYSLLFMGSMAIIFFGCQKNRTPQNKIQESSLHLVPIDTALSIAIHFNPAVFFDASNASNHSPFHSTLNGINAIKNWIVIKDSYGQPAMYAINFTNNQGFVFVSADYQLRPVLGFVENGEFKENAVPSGIVQWGGKTVNNIELVRQGLYDNSKLAQAAWNHYLEQNVMTNNSNNGTISNKQAPPPPPNPCTNNPNYSTSTTQTVGPLLPVTWGQDCSYNNLLTSKNCTDCSVLPVTGCVSTAAAQMVRYWSPVNSYNFNYASMPTTSGNSEVQRLMLDLGLPANVNESYGCASTGGSSADGGTVPGALINHFGFASASRSSYGAASWSTLQTNIGYNWPCLLEGCNTATNVFLGIWYTYSDCHEWVGDGYQQTNVTFCFNGNPTTESYLYFHMNWGWHEWFTNPPYNESDYNGWFAFDNWTISGAGQNGSNLNFQYAQDIVSAIHL